MSAKTSDSPRPGALISSVAHTFQEMPHGPSPSTTLLSQTLWITDLSQRITKNKKRVEGRIDDWLDARSRIWESAKTVYVKESIEIMLEESTEEKMIIFTQWLGMVKVIEKVCETEEWGCCTFIGSMTPQEKTETLREFDKDPNKRILISSLKSGGVGLNLMVASRVIHLDPWYVLENSLSLLRVRLGSVPCH